MVEINPKITEAMSFGVYSVFSTLALVAIFMQRRGPIWAMFVEDLPRNNPIKFGWNLSSGYGENEIVFFSSFTSGSHFVKQSRTIQVILVENLPTNKLCLIEICPVVIEEMLFEVFSILSSGDHFVERSGTVWAILIEDLPRNNPIIWLKSAQWLRRRCLTFFFYFVLWQPFYAVEQKDLSNFGRGPPK